MCMYLLSPVLTCASPCIHAGYINNALAFTAVLFVVIAFSFIPASFAVFVVKEREINAKHQQVRFIQHNVPCNAHSLNIPQTHSRK